MIVLYVHHDGKCSVSCLPAVTVFMHCQAKTEAPVKGRCMHCIAAEVGLRVVATVAYLGACPLITVSVV